MNERIVYLEQAVAALEHAVNILEPRVHVFNDAPKYRPPNTVLAGPAAEVESPAIVPCATGPFVPTAMSQYLTQQPPQPSSVNFHVPHITPEILEQWEYAYNSGPLAHQGTLMEYLSRRINLWFSSIADPKEVV